MPNLTSLKLGQRLPRLEARLRRYFPPHDIVDRYQEMIEDEAGTLPGTPVEEE